MYAGVRQYEWWKWPEGMKIYTSDVELLTNNEHETLTIGPLGPRTLPTLMLSATISIMNGSMKKDSGHRDRIK